jgi:uroporphyrinogen decarboxylase
MISIPIKHPKPDFSEFIDVVEGRKKPSKVHNVEVIVDEEVKEFIIKNYFNEKYYSSVGININSLGDVSNILNMQDYKKAKENYYRMYVKFHYGMGYSIVPDHDFIINLEGFNTISQKKEDTAKLSRGERSWISEGRGLIKNWNDFENFKWNKIEYLLVDYEKHLEFMKKILLDGMKIATVGAMFYQVFSWLLGFEGLFYLVNDDLPLVKVVIDKMAGYTYRMYEIAAANESVGILWHGDDLGFKTATMLSPEILRQLVFPWFKKYSEIAHRNNKKFWIHCCGYKDEIMNDFIDYIKIDALHSFEDSCCMVTEYKKRYGDKIGIIGGVDVDKLCRFDESRLRSYIKGILNSCMEGGRFALGSGNSITNFVPVSNYLIMLDEASRWK